jgi:hypothetical protein
MDVRTRIFEIIKNLLVTLPLLLLLTTASMAQIPDLLTVPEDLPESEKDVLSRQRSAVVAEETDIESQVARHDAKCANVLADSPLEEECRQEKARILQRIEKYAADVKRFNTAVATASREAEKQIVRKEQDELDRSYEVSKEQEEFDKKNAAWLRRQQKQIREAVKKDKAWTNEVLDSIKAMRVPSPIYQPKDLDDLQPGDILLVAPEEGEPISNIISRLDQVYTGRVFKTGEKKSPASHALTVVKTVNGNLLFLDHTSKKGSRIFGEKQFLREYGHRGMYVARPQAVIDGRKLWGVAKEAAKKTREGKGHGLDWTDYGVGVFNKDVVCSDRAALAVVKASGRRLVLNPGNEQVPLQDRWGPIDITPADFFDKENIGKYFIVNQLQQK